MHLAQLIDIPSIMISIGAAVGIGIFVGNGNKRRILQTIRNVSIPCGNIGTLIAFTMMLSYMGGFTTIGLSLSVGLNPILYGLLTYIVTDILLGRISDAGQDTIPNILFLVD